MKLKEINCKLQSKVKCLLSGIIADSDAESLCIQSWHEFWGEWPRCSLRQACVEQKSTLLQEYAAAMNRILPIVQQWYADDARFTLFSRYVGDLVVGQNDAASAWNTIRELLPSMKIEMQVNEINTAYKGMEKPDEKKEYD